MPFFSSSNQERGLVSCSRSQLGTFMERIREGADRESKWRVTEQTN